jgi:hypothetical protein
MNSRCRTRENDDTTAADPIFSPMNYGGQLHRSESGLGGRLVTDVIFIIVI